MCGIRAGVLMAFAVVIHGALQPISMTGGLLCARYAHTLWVKLFLVMKCLLFWIAMIGAAGLAVAEEKVDKKVGEKAEEKKVEENRVSTGRGSK